MFYCSGNGDIFYIGRLGYLLKRKICLIQGYPSFSYWIKFQKKHKSIYVHRCVAEAWLKEPITKMHVNHIDGIKTSNNYSNLEWVSQAQNNRHSIEVLGNVCAGEKNGSSKLSEKEARRIKFGKESVVFLSKELSISKTQIYKIKSGRAWVHVD